MAEGRRRTPVDAVSALAATDLFTGLPAAVLGALAAATVPRHFDKGALLFAEGDPGASLLVIISGAVSIFRTSAGGDKATLTVLRRPDVLGELALLDGAPRSASAETLAPTTLLALRREAFLHLLGSQPALVEPLLAHLSAMVRRLSDQAVDHVFLDLGGRVAKSLLRLAASDPHSARELVPAPYAAAAADARADPPAVGLTQGRLAELVGGSRQSVNAVLSGMAERGIVRVEGRRILLLDLEALRRRAGLAPLARQGGAAP